MSLFNRKDTERFEMDWIQLSRLEQLEEIETESTQKPVLIFKYSTRCIVSRMVLRQFENEFDSHDQLSLYFLDLLRHRDISNAIESRFGVRHESPQLLLIKDGKVIYHASHEDIAATDLKRFL